MAAPCTRSTRNRRSDPCFCQPVARGQHLAAAGADVGRSCSSQRTRRGRSWTCLGEIKHVLADAAGSRASRDGPLRATMSTHRSRIRSGPGADVVPQRQHRVAVQHCFQPVLQARRGWSRNEEAGADVALGIDDGRELGRITTHRRKRTRAAHRGKVLMYALQPQRTLGDEAGAKLLDVVALHARQDLLQLRQIMRLESHIRHDAIHPSKRRADWRRPPR